TSWDVVVTNTGSQADTFDLVASGAPALAGALPATSVSLAAGASQTVQLSAADLSFLMPGNRTFAVMAQSQADGRIRAQDTATFDVAHFSDVRVAWEPDARTVQDALTTSLTLVVTNTGNTV